VHVLAPVAQWIEHLTTDQKVGGSSPSGRADFFGRGWPVEKRETSDVSGAYPVLMSCYSSRGARNLWGKRIMMNHPEKLAVIQRDETMRKLLEGVETESFDLSD
jgi:hypothetical protein